VNTEMYSTSAPHSALRTRAQVATWAVPDQGIRLPFPASQLGMNVLRTSAMSVMTANAAKGATNDAKGDDAFEDPV
jgi:hypothetical protein